MTRTSAQKYAFSQFPEFGRLMLPHKKAYNAMTKDCPPVDDISFSALMTWWNPLDNMSAAQLNDNLVVPYWLPGVEKHTGLSLIGTNMVDESICAIFDYQRERGEPMRLVNVPDFVIAHVRYPGLFKCSEERRYDEYIYSLDKFYPIQTMPIYWRQKVRRRIAQYQEAITTRSIDLSEPANRQLLLDATDAWQRHSLNNYGKVERDALQTSLLHADVLDIQNVCIFLGEELQGFCIFVIPHDKRYISVRHIKVTHNKTLGYEYIGYEMAKYVSDRGVQYVNLNTDQAILSLRMFMLALGPTNFFRKYIVEPAES